ncbi:MAG: hypothetical protein ACHQHN_08510 [Sphingobacteriales bacterium]
MMKLVASILCMYFSLLIAQPFVNMGLNIPNKPDSCHPGMCCKEMQQKNKTPVKQQSSTCNRDFCNPFVPCGTSVAQRVVIHSFTDVALDAPKKLKPAINEDIISNYLPDCWRPPELLS